MHYHLPEMTCGHCVRALRQAFEREMPGVAIDIDLATREVRSPSADPVKLAEVIRAAGYSVQPWPSEA